MKLSLKLRKNGVLNGKVILMLFKDVLCGN